jgi:hypothetical protein
MKENKIEKYVKINWKSIECDVKIKHFFSCWLSHVDVNHFIRASALDVCSPLFSFEDQYLTILNDRVRAKNKRRRNWWQVGGKIEWFSSFMRHCGASFGSRLIIAQNIKKKDAKWRGGRRIDIDDFFGVSLEFRVFLVDC